jgi:hypothetical protein
MMRRSSLFLLAGLAGCGLPTLFLPKGQTNSCQGGAGPTSQMPPIGENTDGGPLLTGVAQKVSYDDSMAILCSDAPKSVQSTVLDPSGGPVPSSAAIEPSQADAGGKATSLVIDVTFTPGAPGWYSIHLDLPPLSPIDTRALVAESRNKTGTPVPFQACKTLDRTTAGTWVCDGNAGQTKLGVTAIVSGNVVWAVDNDSSIVSRYMDSGGGTLSMTHQLSVKQLYGADQMIATTDVLAFSFANQVFWFTVQGATLTAAAPVMLQQIVSSLALVGDPTELIAAGALGNGHSFAACQVQPGVATPSCQAVTGVIVGSDGNTLWALTGRGDSFDQLQAFLPGPVGLASAAQISPPPQFSIMPPSLVVTILPEATYPQGAAPGVQNESIVFDVYDTSPGAQLLGVGSNWVWELTVNGTLTAFPR